MRKPFKSFLIFISTLFILFIVLFYVYRANVISNLGDKKGLVDSKWSEIFENSSSRIDLLKTIDSIGKSKEIIFDSLNFVIDKNLKNRNLYKNECSLDFVKQEFDLNKEYIKVLAKYKVMLF